jgi:uridine kinase
LAPDESTSVVVGLAAAIRSVPRPVVLIDGRSGSGKSTLAGALAVELGAAVVHLEDIYPGWDGLDVAAEHVVRHVLGSSTPRWQRWDWERSTPAGWHDVDPSMPLIVEGSGALSRAGRALATFGVWVELDDEERRRRALDRDGDRYAPHWERWARQEAVFVDRERPQASADAIVRTAPWSLVLHPATHVGGR